MTENATTGAYGIEPVDPTTPGAMICGWCGRAWADDITPAGRCPWEDLHESRDDNAVVGARLAQLAHNAIVQRVETYADGYGTWHARLTVRGDRPLIAAPRIAREAIRKQLDLRSARGTGHRTRIELHTVGIADASSDLVVLDYREKF